MKPGQFPIGESELACLGETMIGNSRYEDGRWECVAECDGGLRRCGFRLVLEDEDEPTWSITSTGFGIIHGQHLAHSFARYKESLP